MVRHVKDYVAVLALQDALPAVPDSANFVLAVAAGVVKDSVQDVEGLAAMDVEPLVKAAVKVAAEEIAPVNVVTLVRAPAQVRATLLAPENVQVVREHVALDVQAVEAGAVERAEVVQEDAAVVSPVADAIPLVPVAVLAAVIQDAIQVVKIRACHLAAVPVFRPAVDSLQHQLF